MWGPFTRLARLLLGAVCIAALLLPAFAEAAPSRKKAIWGPVRVDGVPQFPIYRDLGAGIYQIGLGWAATAPTRPQRPRDPSDAAYRWPAELDDAVRQGRRHGIRIAIVLQGAPRWASGKSDPRWAPRRPGDFADFAFAASRRYPNVRLWMIWPEPTRRANFKPLIHERRDRPLTQKMKRGPRLYSRILDASYASLKRRNRNNLVIGGNSFTTGDVSPLNWIKNLRLPNGRPPRMDMYGHNPFSARRPFLEPSAHRARLRRLLRPRPARRVGRSLPRPSAGPAGHEALPVRALLAHRSPATTSSTSGSRAGRPPAGSAPRCG